jgi:hypothetical protein
MAWPLKWVHLEDVQAGGHRQRSHELAEFDHVHAGGGHVHDLAQGRAQGGAEQPGKAVVDDLQGGHAPADDPVLVGEVVDDDPVGVMAGVGFNLDLAAAHAL